MQKLQKEYDAFVEARDKEFSEFLNLKIWKKFAVKSLVEFYTHANWNFSIIMMK